MLFKEIARSGQIKPNQKEEIKDALSKIFTERHPNLLRRKNSHQTTKTPNFDVKDNRISVKRTKLAKTVLLYFDFVIDGVSYQIKTLVFLIPKDSDSIEFELSIKDYGGIGMRRGTVRNYPRIKPIR